MQSIEDNYDIDSYTPEDLDLTPEAFELFKEHYKTKHSTYDRDCTVEQMIDAWKERYEMELAIEQAYAELYEFGKTMPELRKMKVPPKRTIIKGMLKTRESIKVDGPPGGGKSWFVLALAVIIAYGTKKLNGVLEVDNSFKVFYLDAEMDRDDQVERYDIIKQNLGVSSKEERVIFELLVHSEPNAKVDEIREMERQMGYFPEEMTPYFDILHPHWMEKIAEQVLKAGCNVLVLDNLTNLTSFDGKGENDAEAGQMLSKFIYYMRAKEISCVVAHHTGKIYEDQDRTKAKVGRGSSNLDSPFNCVFSVYEGRERYNKDRGLFHLKWQASKQRGREIVREGTFLVWDTKGIEFLDKDYEVPADPKDAVGMHKENVRNTLKQTIGKFFYEKSKGKTVRGAAITVADSLSKQDLLDAELITADQFAEDKHCHKSESTALERYAKTLGIDVKKGIKPEEELQFEVVDGDTDE